MEDKTQSTELSLTGRTIFTHLIKTYQLSATRSTQSSGLQPVLMISAYEFSEFTDFSYNRLPLICNC
ncbi:hypothetical protein C7Y66_14225 [Chroococcidiopsis sp. CCALA 051]|nr:hypothetical protein C7Y66_14225 [Chroococcidiopsis sp. CCALA 051]